jgi:hypothetical protein
MTLDVGIQMVHFLATSSEFGAIFPQHIREIRIKVETREYGD